MAQTHTALSGAVLLAYPIPILGLDLLRCPKWKFMTTQGSGRFSPVCQLKMLHGPQHVLDQYELVYDPFPQASLSCHLLHEFLPILQSEPHIPTQCNFPGASSSMSLYLSQLLPLHHGSSCLKGDAELHTWHIQKLLRSNEQMSGGFDEFC